MSSGDEKDALEAAVRLAYYRIRQKSVPASEISEFESCDMSHIKTYMMTGFLGVHLRAKIRGKPLTDEQLRDIRRLDAFGILGLDFDIRDKNYCQKKFASNSLSPLAQSMRDVLRRHSAYHTALDRFARKHPRASEAEWERFRSDPNAGWAPSQAELDRISESN
eukprot:TRINITY_DN4122_c0_g1_i3.p1 TRINITY_DN4122_c0_g1~~TRINITY_DN4122_c0_g1_i3.p1  ORF type:complete len:164 (-),score=14.38 TRINITY_DN4122_c0_g1_i3:111-602(-)